MDLYPNHTIIALNENMKYTQEILFSKITYHKETYLKFKFVIKWQIKSISQIKSKQRTWLISDTKLNYMWIISNYPI